MSHKHYLTGIFPRKQQSCPGGSTLELKRESWRVNGRVVDDDYFCKGVLHLINQILATSLSDFGSTNRGSQKHPKTSGLCLFLRLRQQIRLSTASLDAFKKQSKTNVALCISGKVMKSVWFRFLALLGVASKKSLCHHRKPQNIKNTLWFTLISHVSPNSCHTQHHQTTSNDHHATILLDFDPWSFGKKRLQAAEFSTNSEWIGLRFLCKGRLLRRHTSHGFRFKLSKAPTANTRGKQGIQQEAAWQCVWKSNWSCLLMKGIVLEESVRWMQND